MVEGLSSEVFLAVVKFIGNSLQKLAGGVECYQLEFCC